ncbi:DinB family protein [Chitinophagaceae bacterium 26-R-25]|nr:DinB family protein [Chitinophagaceae bacterium 26-R-25]
MQQPEYWMRGPIEGIPALLQPVAHALLQARDEVNELMSNFPEHRLWEKPANVASPAFHLQHITGVLDRLFTYAIAQPLNQGQLAYLSAEGKKNDTVTLNTLLINFNKQIDLSLEQLKTTNENSLTEFRGVGRKQLPSTVMGLLFHAAEHTMRHTGQLLVTVKVLVEN